MSVLLPADPAPAEPTTPSYLDFGGVQRPFLGGADQKLNRLGDRFALDVTMPTMDAVTARRWIARLIRARKDGALLAWPQPGLTIANPGSPVVNGPGQLGSSLVVRSFAASYFLPEGMFFSVIIGGRRYLHLVAADTTLSGSGTGTVPIAPMLRASPGDGAIIEIVTPYIEGFLEGNELDWTVSMAAHVGLAFKITEAE